MEILARRFKKCNQNIFRKRKSVKSYQDFNEHIGTSSRVVRVLSICCGDKQVVGRPCLEIQCSVNLDVAHSIEVLNSEVCRVSSRQNILNIGDAVSIQGLKWQTEEQSDQGLHYLQFTLHLLATLLYGRDTLFKF